MTALAVIVLLSLPLSSPPDGNAAAIKRIERFGRSVNEVPLRAYNVGAKSSGTRVLVVGCIHGNECAGKRIVRRLRHMRAPRSYELWLVWSTNPDGASARTRQNARGVDLNRNFPVAWRSSGSAWDTYYPGPRPASEPETRAAMRLVADLRPDITIWYHQAMSLVTKSRRHRSVQRRYARRVGLPWVKLDPLPGTASRWQNRRYPGHLSFVVELPAGRLSARSARSHALAVRRAGFEWAHQRRR